MLAYVTMHLLNHAVGLISLKAMEDVLWYIFRIWSNRPAQALLYGSFLVHYGLALWALWQRRSLRLRPSELSQIILGFAIPILLARHVVGTRIADNFFHTDTGYYAYLLWVYFVRFTRTRLFADAGSGRRVEPRDDRPPFLAARAALVFARSSQPRSCSPCSSRCCPCSA